MCLQPHTWAAFFSTTRTACNSSISCPHGGVGSGTEVAAYLPARILYIRGSAPLVGTALILHIFLMVGLCAPLVVLGRVSDGMFVPVLQRRGTCIYTPYSILYPFTPITPSLALSHTYPNIYNAHYT